ncbi:hypothetical protein PHMEG_00015210 [Phytophthora megakarya]|uniref:Uncharacterized protein n=1 Tax=Phytophthora megakarya TaxID=4795 RepID=A0A225W3Z4_9STRA|nr:hypothetical protein PHMEG_00015210 [Phytophthora megakarya]
MLTITTSLPSSGYTNFVGHLKDKHADYKYGFEAHLSRQAGCLTVHGFVSPEVVNMYQWMEWIVDHNMPLSEVGDPLTRARSKLKPTCSKSMKAYLSTTVVAIEDRIATERIRPRPYGRQLDPQFKALRRAVHSVLAVDQLQQLLLAIAPMVEGEHTTQSHCEFMKKITAIFAQSESTLAFLIRDNFATKRATCDTAADPAD